MAKCELCGKTIATGNRISIARSHVSHGLRKHVRRSPRHGESRHRRVHGDAGCFSLTTGRCTAPAHHGKTGTGTTILVPHFSNQIDCTQFNCRDATNCCGCATQ